MYNIINYIVEAFKKFGHFPPKLQQKKLYFFHNFDIIGAIFLKKICLKIWNIFQKPNLETHTLLKKQLFLKVSIYCIKIFVCF